MDRPGKAEEKQLPVTSWENREDKIVGGRESKGKSLQGRECEDSGVSSIFNSIECKKGNNDRGRKALLWLIKLYFCKFFDKKL